MIRWALIFLVVAVIAGLLGFGVIANVAFDIAKFFFFVFLGITVLLFIAGWWAWKKVT
jgi:uncharacterized membrane protein YtjA (UPF0391 family)